MRRHNRSQGSEILPTPVRFTDDLAGQLDLVVGCLGGKALDGIEATGGKNGSRLKAGSVAA